jgi:glyceraldehyde 3-phosphate dehydrogenase
MTVKIAINGFGRIGRQVFRILCDRKDFEVVAINDLGEPAVMAHLLKYDSVHGTFKKSVKLDGNKLIVDGKSVTMLQEKDPKNLPWGKVEAYFVVESTGVFTKREQCEQHIAAGAKKVLLTVPPKDEVDALIVMGVNEHMLKPEHKIISNASCTTNCLAPVAKVLHENFGIVRGLMNTIHAYTNDQRILDLPHKDLRRARAAAENIIPTTTGAARAVGKVLPELKGKLDGFSLRVPVKDGSVVDLVCEIKKKATAEEINAAMKKAAEGPMKGILEYTEDEVVSTDIIGKSCSSTFDSKLTFVFNDTMVRCIAWYDNEWGYSNRVVDLMALAAKK